MFISKSNRREGKPLASDALPWYPNKDNPFLVELVVHTLPLIYKFVMGGIKVKVLGSGLKTFKSLPNNTIVAPNHSNNKDPEVTGTLARLSGQRMNYVCAAEVFAWRGGWMGKYLQATGVYSVVRGAKDTVSMDHTIDLLCQGKKKLVIFPEGEISWQNDELMPLEKGIPQMAFWAQKKLLDDTKSPDVAKSIYILPTAMKYFYTEDIRPNLWETIRRIERHLNIKSDETMSMIACLRAIAEACLSDMARVYKVRLPEEASLSERIDTMRSTILAEMADQLGISLSAKQSQLHLVREIRNALDRIPVLEGVSDYQKQLRIEQTKHYYANLERVVNFIAMTDGYISRRPTQERVSHVLDRLEMDLFDLEQPPIRGKREAWISVSEEPICILDSWDAYKAKRKATLQAITDDMSNQISRMLSDMDNSREVILVS